MDRGDLVGLGVSSGRLGLDGAGADLGVCKSEPEGTLVFFGGSDGKVVYLGGLCGSCFMRMSMLGGSGVSGRPANSGLSSGDESFPLQEGQSEGRGSHRDELPWARPRGAGDALLWTCGGRNGPA